MARKNRLKEEEGFKTIVKIPVIREDFGHAGEGSSQLKRELVKLGYSPATIRRVAVASYEAELNIVIHSLGGELEAGVRPQAVKIVARDRGPGIKDIEKAMEQGFSTAPAHIQQMGFGAGMGLPNIKKSCDEFTIESSKGNPTTITMVIREPATGEAAG
ncbi:MAG: ATP-binding protein [Peptococcaceae bacterium]|nr:ATP-binding protein [Peptococcaceae bacterium]